MRILSRKFYNRDTVQVAKDLLGKTLVRKIGKQKLTGTIIETEAYKGKNDPASHSSKKKTERNKVCLVKLGGHMFISPMACTIALMLLQKKIVKNLVRF